MNFYFKEYSNATCEGWSKKKWKAFGLNQLNLLFDYFNAYLDPDLKSKLNSICTLEVVPRNTILQKQNEPITGLFYILSGTAKKTIDIGDEEQITMLYDEGGLIMALDGLVNGTPAEVNIKTIEKCFVLVLKYEDLLSLMNSEHGQNLKDVVTLVVNKAGASIIEFSSILRFPNEQKVAVLHEKYPILFEKFTLKNIASLIGINPESLTRLNKLVLSKNSTN